MFFCLTTCLSASFALGFKFFAPNSLYDLAWTFYNILFPMLPISS